jgi:DNA-binding transcriptional MerR regulator
MRIGELAKQSGIPIETIRYYERLRLLREPPRTASGYRSYPPAALDRLRFIKMTQGLGFALKEVRELLQLHSTMAALPAPGFVKSAELSSIVRMAEAKRAQIEEKIASLRSLSRQLQDFIAGLQQRPEPICPATKNPSRTGL